MRLKIIDKRYPNVELLIPNLEQLSRLLGIGDIKSKATSCIILDERHIICIWVSMVLDSGNNEFEIFIDSHFSENSFSKLESLK